MNVDAQTILTLRTERAWSQEHLAETTGLNLRTIQRIEKSGTASLQSVRALASAFDLDVGDLAQKEPDVGDVAQEEPEVDDLAQKERQMSPCPECRSDEVYQSRKLGDTTTIGGELLPNLAPSRFSSAKILPVVCASCGYVRFFADDDAREKLRKSKHWRRV